MFSPYCVVCGSKKIYASNERKAKISELQKGYNSIRSSKDISITRGDRYIKESQSARSVASKRSTTSS